MYFHDLTFEKELTKVLIANEFQPSWIQAEHKLGRVRISFAASFDDLNRLTYFMDGYFKQILPSTEWKFKSIEQSEINCLVEFKEIITINHP